MSSTWQYLLFYNSVSQQLIFRSTQTGTNLGLTNSLPYCYSMLGLYKLQHKHTIKNINIIIAIYIINTFVMMVIRNDKIDDSDTNDNTQNNIL